MAKKAPVRRSYFKYLLALWLGFVAVLAGTFIFFNLLVAGKIGPMPDPEVLEKPELLLASEVYTTDSILLGKYYVQNRSRIGFNELSPYLVQGLIDTEDARFREHSGIDIIGLIRVLVKTVILRQNAGGGSTISQQLAKNLFPREKFSGSLGIAGRKLREWVIAVQLEARYTKNELVAFYLNTVPFGDNSYGIKSASRVFFNKPPKNLKIEEAAILIGMLKANTYYNPRLNPENALRRRNVVMHQMVRYGHLEVAKYDSLKQLPIVLNPHRSASTSGLAPHFRAMLRKYMLEWCENNINPETGEPYDLYEDGLKIYTTLDTRLQQYAEQAVEEHLKDLQLEFYKNWKGHDLWEGKEDLLERDMKQSARYRSMKKAGIGVNTIRQSFNEPVPMRIFTYEGSKDTMMSPLDSIKYYKAILQTGFLVLDPRNGFVRAWVGGNDFDYFQYDHVKQGRRQVGSTFKPFLYATAVQDRVVWPCKQIPNIAICIPDGTGKDWCPGNSGSKKHEGEMVTVKFGLANSINWIAVRIMDEVGPENVVKIAKGMGISTEIPPYPAIALGVCDLPVYEIVGAYTGFANEGRASQPMYISKITDRRGKVIESFMQEPRKGIYPETAYLMTRMLQGVVDGEMCYNHEVRSGTGMRLRSYPNLRSVPIAGKTGTTQNGADGWFIGYTPQLLAGAWVGHDDQAIRFRTGLWGQGSRMALPIWGKFMNKVYADESVPYKANLPFPDSPQPTNVLLDCQPVKPTDPGEIF